MTLKWKYIKLSGNFGENGGFHLKFITIFVLLVGEINRFYFLEKLYH